MHVLTIPSWYPLRENPTLGVYLFEQIQALQQADVQMGVVYPEQRSMRNFSLKTLSANRFQVRYYEEDGIPTLRRHSWNIFWRLPLGIHVRVRDAQRLTRRYVERFGVPDLIHAHSTLWAGAAAAQISNEHNIPFVLTEHYSGFQRRDLASWRLRLARQSFRAATRVVTVNTSLRTLLIERGFTDADHTRVIYNLVNPDFFHLPSKKRSASPFRFFALSSFYPWKGMDLLIQAFASAFGDRHDVRLNIGGDGPERARVERLAHRLGVQSQIRFLGSLSRKEVRRSLWNAHAFVHPSYQETFGVVLIEAMATGLPVIATACGGPEDIVTPSTGCLVSPQDSNALAQGMREIYRKADRYHAPSLHKQAVQRFGIRIFVQRAMSLYRDALSIQHKS